MWRKLRDRYQSKPIMMMDEQAAREWVAAHPDCPQCGQIIDPYGDAFTVHNDSSLGVSAHHQHCPGAQR